MPATKDDTVAKDDTAAKPKVTKEELEKCGVTYNAIINGTTAFNGDESLPDHVQIVRDGILDFDNFIIKDQFESSEINVKAYIHRKNLPDSREERWKYDMSGEFIAMAKELAHEANILKIDNVTESEWQVLFNTTIFKRRRDQQFSNPVKLNISTTKHLAWNSNTVTRWNEAHSIQTLDGNKKTPTAPQPDIYCGFAIHDMDPEQYLDYGFGKDDFIQNFSVDTMMQLKQKGLSGAPSTGFETEVNQRRKSGKTGERIRRHELLCFPWAVVELKRQEKGDQIDMVSRPVYCQAANGGSAALGMLESLAQFAEVKIDNQHIPPVVTITCIGGKTKVWLAYSKTIKGGRRNHRMVCIWEGYIYKEWDSIQFCRILHNTFSWAETILRPKVSHYIDQWRSRKSPRAEELQIRVEHDPQLCSLVHKIEQSLSSLRFRGSSHFIDVAELIVSVRDAVESLSQNAKAPPEDVEIEKSETTVAKCDPVVASETPIEERKISELSLRDVTEHFERLGIAPVQHPQKVQDATPLANPLVIEHTSFPVGQTFETLGKIVDNLSQNVIKLEKSYNSLHGSQMLKWATFMDLNTKMESSRNGVTEKQSSHAGTMTVSTPSINVLTNSHSESMTILESKQSASVSTGSSFVITKAGVNDIPEASSSALTVIPAQIPPLLKSHPTHVIFRTL